MAITLPTSVTGITGARQVSPRQLNHRADAHPCRAEQLVSTRSQVRTSPRSRVASPFSVLSAVMPSRASSRVASSRQSVAPVQLSPLVGPARCTWPTSGLSCTLGQVVGECTVNQHQRHLPGGRMCGHQRPVTADPAVPPRQADHVTSEQFDDEDRGKARAVHHTSMKSTSPAATAGGRPLISPRLITRRAAELCVTHHPTVL